jgi:hypothetical protein
MIGYTFDLEAISLLPTASLCASSFSNSFVEVTTQEIELALRAARIFDFPYVSLHLGLGAGAAFLRQGFKTTGAAPDRWTAAGLVSTNVALTVDLTQGAFFGLDVSGILFVLRREDIGGEVELAAVPSAAISIFAGKRW